MGLVVLATNWHWSVERLSSPASCTNTPMALTSIHVNKRTWCLFASQLVCCVADRGTSSGDITALLYLRTWCDTPPAAANGRLHIATLTESVSHSGVKAGKATQEATLSIFNGHASSGGGGRRDGGGRFVFPSSFSLTARVRRPPSFPPFPVCPQLAWLPSARPQTVPLRTAWSWLTASRSRRSGVPSELGSTTSSAL